MYKILTDIFSRSIVLLALAFIVSLIIRSPFINRPLSEHHETITAHMLITLRIWYENGIAPYRFSPVYTTPGDIWSECLKGSICDEYKNIYYVSYPPFAFYVPYALFSLLGIYPSVLPLQIFNLSLHFVCAVLIYLTVLKIQNKTFKKTIDLPAFIAYFVYLFTPQTLWFHSNTYFSEIFVQVFFIGLLYLSAVILSSEHLSRRVLYSFGIVLFLCAFTEWIGVLYAVVFGAYLVVSGNKRRDLGAVCLIAPLLAMVLTFAIYSPIAGTTSYISLFTSKLESRSGLMSPDLSDGGIVLSWKALHDYLWGHYKRGYSVVLYLIGVYVVVLIHLRGSIRTLLPKNYSILLLFASMPVILHHIIFFNFTAIHDFSVLKSAPFLAIVLGLLIAEVFTQPRFKNTFKAGVAVVLVILLFFSANKSFVEANTLDYLALNRWKNMGEFIYNNSQPDELVFVRNGYFDLRLFYYTRRTVLPVGSIEEAESRLAVSKFSKGIVFSIDSNSNVSIESKVQR